MTKHISDEDLLNELKLRIDQNNKALSDLTVVNRKLLELNHKLQDSETLKSNFLSNIRNEINNPLNAIMGLADQISFLSTDNDITTFAGIIASEAQNLDFQLKNIFMAAELEAGMSEPEPSRVSICALAQDVINSHTSSARQKNITIKIDCQELQLADFCTDASKLQVILSNLLANAIEFSHEGDSVEISATVQEGRLLLNVRDNGIGINPDDFHRIFDRFVQLDTGTQRQHHGHGLGLCVVKSLLDLMGGTITIKSQPEAGSVFAVTIPEIIREDEEMMFADGGNLFLFDEPEEK